MHLIERLGEIGARHGIGIVDQIEDRIVGLKVRDIYEVPAATILLAAHRELEALVGTIHQHQVKPALDQKWAYLVYAGLWWEPLRTDLDAYMEAANSQVTGTVAREAVQGLGARRDPHARRTPSTTRSWRRSASRAGCSRRMPRPDSSSCSRCSRGWRGVSATARTGSLAPMGYKLLGWFMWQRWKRDMRRRVRHDVRASAIVLAAGLVVGAVVAVQRQQQRSD